mmetsp:Transcript_5680/g.15408  ORF Transcript_5680/g.15408 Transcript_5680/m.15408 type:complete len:234 (-) Transcript_5680:122-823(-)
MQDDINARTLPDFLSLERAREGAREHWCLHTRCNSCTLIRSELCFFGNGRRSCLCRRRIRSPHGINRSFQRRRIIHGTSDFCLLLLSLAIYNRLRRQERLGERRLLRRMLRRVEVGPHEKHQRQGVEDAPEENLVAVGFICDAQEGLAVDVRHEGDDVEAKDYAGRVAGAGAHQAQVRAVEDGQEATEPDDHVGKLWERLRRGFRVDGQEFRQQRRLCAAAAAALAVAFGWHG